MTRAKRILGMLGIVLALMLAIVPGKALASSYPSPADITFDGLPLAQYRPEGVSYNSEKGILTLNNYDGGPIGIWGCEADFTIVLKGNNKITIPADAEYGYGCGIDMTSSNDSILYITASQFATLDITYDAPTLTDYGSVVGINNWGGVYFTGDAAVYINLASQDTTSADLGFVGVQSDNGMIGIRDLANLYIDLDVARASTCCGFKLDSEDNLVFIGTGKSVIVDDSDTAGSVETYSIIVDTYYEPYGDYLIIRQTPEVWLGGDWVLMTNYDGEIDYSDPAIRFYDRTWSNQDHASVYRATFVPMYRLYNKWTGEHFYTADPIEREDLRSVGWTYEGVGWCAPKSGYSVYRLYNPWAPGGDHHYTMDQNEYNNLIKVGWKGEGVAWYSPDPDKQIQGFYPLPVYREYNPYEFAHNHNYTEDVDEHNNLINVGWLDEGIGWYAVPV